MRACVRHVSNYLLLLRLAIRIARIVRPSVTFRLSYILKQNLRQVVGGSCVLYTHHSPTSALILFAALKSPVIRHEYAV